MRAYLAKHLRRIADDLDPQPEPEAPAPVWQPAYPVYAGGSCCPRCGVWIAWGAMHACWTVSTGTGAVPWPGTSITYTN